MKDPRSFNNHCSPLFSCGLLFIICCCVSLIHTSCTVALSWSICNSLLSQKLLLLCCTSHKLLFPLRSGQLLPLTSLWPKKTTRTSRMLAPLCQRLKTIVKVSLHPVTPLLKQTARNVSWILPVSQRLNTAVRTSQHFDSTARRLKANTIITDTNRQVTGQVRCAQMAME